MIVSSLPLGKLNVLEEVLTTTTVVISKKVQFMLYEIAPLHLGCGFNLSNLFIFPYSLAPLNDWISLNMSTSLSYDDNLSWQDIFMVTCWRLWYWHNREVADHRCRRPPRLIKLLRAKLRRST